MKSRTLVSVSVILGILFVILAFVYWFTPAGSLPSFMPGYIAGATGVHIKHGLAALGLGLLLFVLAWFKSGKKDVSAAGSTGSQLPQ